MFPDIVEYNGPGRHVDPHSECFCCEEKFHPSFGETALDNLLQYRQHPRVVDSDASFQQLGQLQNLRQPAVGPLEPRDTLADKVVDVRLLHGGRQVQAGQEGSVLGGHFLGNLVALLRDFGFAGRAAVGLAADLRSS